MQKAKYILSECYIEEENSCWISKMRYRWTGLTYRLGLLFVECDPYLHRERGATHTVTHTRKRTDGNNGTNRLRPHPFWTKNRPKALYSSGWMAFERLVRMRSAVRICPAAPKCVDERCSTENAARKCGVFAYNAPLLEWKSCKNLIFQNFSFAQREATFWRCALPDLWSGVVRTPRLKKE